MALSKLPASAEFFKQLSLECQQLRITLQLLDTLAFRASVRGRQLGDQPLLLILDQIEICVSKAQDFMDDLEILSQFGL
jgi:hypothetical protein